MMVRFLDSALRAPLEMTRRRASLKMTGERFATLVISTKRSARRDLPVRSGRWVLPALPCSMGRFLDSALRASLEMTEGDAARQGEKSGGSWAGRSWNGPQVGRRQKSLPICVSVSAGLNFAIAMIGGLYYSSGAMAPEGQASAQVPQSMQTLGSIT